MDLPKRTQKVLVNSKDYRDWVKATFYKDSKMFINENRTSRFGNKPEIKNIKEWKQLKN